MANELTLTAKLSFAKGDVAAIARSFVDKKFDVTLTKFHAGVQNVGFAADEALVLGDIAVANLGYCIMQNMDDTNFVDVFGVTMGTALIRLLAGEITLFRFKPGITPAVQADTAAVEIQYMIVEA